MRTAIVGLPQVGKTTIFKILAGARTSLHGSHSMQSSVGIVKVPDARLDRLAALFHPHKTTYATFELVDVAETDMKRSRDGEPHSSVKNVEAFLHVIRAFGPPLGDAQETTAQPKRDLENFELNLILSDLMVVERRLERLDKDLKKMKSVELERERELLLEFKKTLENGCALRSLALSAEDQKRIRGFMFLSEKPILHCINLDDRHVDKMNCMAEHLDLKAKCDEKNVVVTAVCGKIESEMAELEADEAQAFLQEYGMKESGRDRIIHATYALLNLITFFTVGEDECRAWPIHRGTAALHAAGTVHSDFESHFIRAEVISWEKLLEVGSFHAAREKGLLRLEGKDYLVQDGDILHIRHSG